MKSVNRIEWKVLNKINQMKSWIDEKIEWIWAVIFFFVILAIDAAIFGIMIALLIKEMWKEWRKKK
jgi:hypothetical protein